jgi:hypothetical protein
MYGHSGRWHITECFCCKVGPTCGGLAYPSVFFHCSTLSVRLRWRTSFTSSDVREATFSLLVLHIIGETEVIQACLYTSRELHPRFVTDVVASFPYTQFVPVHSPLPASVVLCQLIPAVECSRGVRSGLKEYLERPSATTKHSPRCELGPLGTITHLSLTKRL